MAKYQTSDEVAWFDNHDGFSFLSLHFDLNKARRLIERKPRDIYRFKVEAFKDFITSDPPVETPNAEGRFTIEINSGLIDWDKLWRNIDQMF